jgi:hypothetical protein
VHAVCVTHALLQLQAHKLPKPQLDPLHIQHNSTWRLPLWPAGYHKQFGSNLRHDLDQSCDTNISSVGNTTFSRWHKMLDCHCISLHVHLSCCHAPIAVNLDST